MIRIDSTVLCITAFLLLSVAIPTSTEHKQHSCPEECRCTIQDSINTAHCTSLSFVRKLSPKELSNILSLDIANTTTQILDKKQLRKLVNLERLNLSYNRLTDIKHFPHLPKLTHLNLRSNYIKSFTGKQLPGKLEVLDVSHNYIQDLPSDLPLTSLKRIYIGGNSFTCTRESIDIRDLLLERKIKIIGRATCNGPSKFQGESWLHVVDFDEYLLQNQDEMQADAPEGSGFNEEGSGLDIFKHKHPVEVPDHKTTEDNDFEFEDEGSGVEEIPTTTEMNEIQDYDEESGSGIIPPIRIDDEDENDKYLQVTDKFTSPEPIEEEFVTKKTLILQILQEVPKPTTEAVVISTEDSAIYAEDHINEELGKVQANQTERGSLGVNIFLVIIVICLVCLLVYAIKKNKERKRRRTRQKAEDIEQQKAGIELLPKTSIPLEKQNGNPETTPLMNGQNGEQEKEAETNMSAPVELRKKEPLNDRAHDTPDIPYLSVTPYPPSPDVVSVKVKASEIPDSIPRTPILVDRRKTSDGQNIVVTPNLNLRASTGD